MLCCSVICGYFCVGLFARLVCGVIVCWLERGDCILGLIGYCIISLVVVRVLCLITRVLGGWWMSLASWFEALCLLCLWVACGVCCGDFAVLRCRFVLCVILLWVAL